ncbi:cysteine-rich venom protein natrin-2-like isoform X2 [Cylas formicarius]|nr:cysteine-rich venom protein natrin-2-like isoform X2 [Cylas formicarius]XP_060516925.1 cysteine-rich venom protein natrin-2-like isoform X2 [Cylas formicarius]
MGPALPFAAISPARERVRNKIVAYHNFFRSKVKPLASNMLKMKWHDRAARAAQIWARKCRFLVHDSPAGRHVTEYGACGQNIFVATKRVPWFFAVETWWLEKDRFAFGKKNNLTVVGHYTQLVWAATHEVGCGLAECSASSVPWKKFYNYVCNYCPTGNWPGRVARPYEKGNPCSACKKNCSRKLCLNACPTANVWANCDYLYKAHPHWLCNSQTPKGRERSSFCKATCTCRHQIHF